MFGRLVVLGVCFAVVTIQTAGTDDSGREALLGEWLLNAALSDSVKKKFSAFDDPVRGGFRDGGIGAGASGRLGRSTGARSAEQIEFEQDEPDRIARNISMRKIVSASTIQIAGAGELIVIYDRKYKRRLVPNSYGRVFSASGDELIVDCFGHTLSFWRNDVLVVETTTRDGVDIVERYRFDPKISKLRVSSSVTPSGRAGIEFVRVFDAVTSVGAD